MKPPAPPATITEIHITGKMKREARLLHSKAHVEPDGLHLHGAEVVRFTAETPCRIFFVNPTFFNTHMIELVAPKFSVDLEVMAGRADSTDYEVVQLGRARPTATTSSSSRGSTSVTSR